MEDTEAKATRRYFELLRQVAPARRLEMCASLTRAVRDLAKAGIQAAAPRRPLADEELRRRLAERLYGAAVARRLFGERAE